MDKVRCAAGHFFDRDRFDRCPFCGSAVGGRVAPGSAPPSRPSRAQMDIDDEATRILGRSSQSRRTVSMQDPARAALPTGWLICTDGPCRGQTFPCRTGRTAVGRDPETGILPPERSAEAAALVLCQPQTWAFWIQEGTGQEPVTLNDGPISVQAPLAAYDRLRIGTGEYVFLPLCGDRFHWDEDRG